MKRHPKPKQAPVHACGLRHFNFVTCFEARIEAEAAEASAVIPQFVQREGYGDRLESYHRQGNTYWRKRD